jgi:hypothetical protein
MLFGNFTIQATDKYAVDIHLGATPPGMKLKVTFTHGDRQWSFSPSHHPDVVAHAVIDPYAKDKGDVVEHTDGDVIWNWKRTQEENKATTIHIGCRPQRALGELSTQYCNVDAQLVFESESEGPGHSEEVAIPPEPGPLRHHGGWDASQPTREVEPSGSRLERGGGATLHFLNRRQESFHEPSGLLATVAAPPEGQIAPTVGAKLERMQVVHWLGLVAAAPVGSCHDFEVVDVVKPHQEILGAEARELEAIVKRDAGRADDNPGIGSEARQGR